MDELKQTVEPTEENITDEMADLKETETTKHLRETVENVTEKIRTEALIRGARMTATVVLQTINKHLSKKGDVSKRDLERCFKEISTFVTGLLKQTENDQEQEESLSDDGKTEETT